MSAFVLLSNRCADSSSSSDDPVERTKKVLLTQGFTRFERFEGSGRQLLYAYSLNDGAELVARDGDDWLVAAGTLIYKGATGPNALLRLLREFSYPLDVHKDLIGQFALVVYRGGTYHVLTDYLGAFQLFHDSGSGVFSTSFLCICEQKERLEFDTQSVYEYVFGSAVLGNASLIKDISRVGPESQLSIKDSTCESTAIEPQPAGEMSSESLQDLVLDSIEHLTSIVATAVDIWGDNIQAPLSGGLDSRLILALLLKCGSKPHVYVYGSEQSQDVKIARQVASRLGFKIDVFDKMAWRQISVCEFAEQVQRNFLECDGFVTDGGLFDNGGNAHARQQRQANGALAVSGGGGEVFRNFFYLPNKPMPASDVARAFFCQYDTRTLTSRFADKRYFAAIVNQIEQTVGGHGKHLTRTQVELLYPRLRCRSFFGREISIVGRYGSYLLPFLEYPVTAAAHTVPMRLKHAGELESRILAEVHGELAAIQSSYGHTFKHGASLGHKVSETMTVVRPPRLRQASYTIKHRTGNLSSDQAAIVDPMYLDTVVDPSLPVMSQFFHVGAVRDSSMLLRLYGLEYLATQLGVSG